MAVQGTSEWDGAQSFGLRGLYPLFILALINLVAAALVVGSALSNMQNVSAEMVRHMQAISTANEILSITRDAETGQRGYLLMGRDEYLDPFRSALNRVSVTWRTFDAFQLDPAQMRLRDDIRKTFDEKIAFHVRTITTYQAGDHARAMANMRTGRGKTVMDRLHAQVAAFKAHEERALAEERKSADAMRFEVILTLIGGLAFIGSGALTYAAVRRARADAGRQAARANRANQRFKATFDQAGVGCMHIDCDGSPLLVNNAMCEMTGYSREDFVTATPDSPAFPANLFSDRTRSEALIDGDLDSYRHERLTRTKDGREIFLVSVVSAVRSRDGDIQFLSAIISDLTDQHHAEKNLHDSQERLRRLQDEFAHVARVNDLGEMAAAIAHEVNQPLTVIANYLSVASKMTGQMQGADNLLDVLRRASDQTLRAGQIVKRMRSFVQRGDETREVELIDTLIASAIEMTMIGSDRNAVEVVRTGNVGSARVFVDPIQFQQALIILMRNAIEAFDTSGCPGKCRIDVSTRMKRGAKNVIVEVADNGPGLDPELARDVFKPFVTSKPGNMGMGLSIARRLIDSHGGRLTMVEQKKGGAVFRIAIPLSENNLTQAA